MEAHQYKHTAVVDRNSWFLRLYLWMWEAEIQKVDFCRLFWGFIFAPLNLTVRAIGFPFYATWRWVLKPAGRLVRHVWDSIEPAQHVPLRPDFAVSSKPKPKKDRSHRDARRKARRELYDRFFHWVGSGVDRLVSGVQRIWPILRVVGFGLFGLLIAGSAVAVMFLLYLAATAMPSVLYALGVTANAIAIAAVWALPYFGLLVAGCAITFLLLAGGKRANVGQKAGKGAMGFSSVMRMGYVGVKSRTCPRIQVTD